MSQRPVEYRFWQRVDSSGGPDACWPWLGRKSRRYGVFERGNRHQGTRRVYLAHRIAFMLTNGEIPEDQPNICHHCDNPPCCNPRHLFAGSHQENIADMTAKGRAAWRNKRMPLEYMQRGEEHHNSKLTAADVVTIRELATRGMMQRKIAQRFGIHQVTVSKIVLRKSWEHVA